MRHLIVFNSISLDGYFTDANGDLQWAHRRDAQWDKFVQGNASGDGVLLFGRVTYEMMANFWPTPLAMKSMPSVAKQMNARPKVVFSRTLKKAEWNNTRLVQGDPAAEVRKLKKKPGPGLVVLGSGTLVSQLAQKGLVDAYHFAVVPVVLGAGRTLFEGVTKKLEMKLVFSKAFKNGNLFVKYEPAK